MCVCTSHFGFVFMMNHRRFAFCCTQYKPLYHIVPVLFKKNKMPVNVCEKLCHSMPTEGALCSWDRRAYHFLTVEEVVCQSPSLRGRPPSKVSARPPHYHTSSPHRRHPSPPRLPFPHLSPLFAARCFRPWRRVRSESRRRLIWRCSGKWLACPRIGNASIATSAARPMWTWQWALSSVPPAPESCKLIFTRHSHVCR